MYFYIGTRIIFYKQRLGLLSQMFEKIKQHDYVVFFDILSNTKKTTKQQKTSQFHH